LGENICPENALRTFPSHPHFLVFLHDEQTIAAVIGARITEFVGDFLQDDNPTPTSSLKVYPLPQLLEHLLEIERRTPIPDPNLDTLGQ
jgi:hypothetical protein